MSLDVEKFVSGLHDYLAQALRPLAERIKALEARDDNERVKRLSEHLARIETRVARLEKK